jgi:hypothetical protein
LTTTTIALFAAWALQKYGDENIMGWYANLVFPVGALLIGLVASSGYGIASWFSGVKIHRWLLGLILFLQIFAYFAAHYMEFRSHGSLVHRDTGAPVTFPEYFQVATTSMTWKSTTTHTTPAFNKPEEPEPLGAWGYLVRLGELVGFVGGSVVAPLILLSHPYCELCQLYMKKKELVWIPGSAGTSFIPRFGAKKQESAALSSDIREQGSQQLQALCDAGKAGEADAFRQQLAELRPASKKAKSLPARFKVEMVRCKNCAAGYLNPSVVTGSGNRVTAQSLGKIELAPDFVRSVTEG